MLLCAFSGLFDMSFFPKIHVWFSLRSVGVFLLVTTSELIKINCITNMQDLHSHIYFFSKGITVEPLKMDTSREEQNIDANINSPLGY